MSNRIYAEAEYPGLRDYSICVITSYNDMSNRLHTETEYLGLCNGNICIITTY